MNSTKKRKRKPSKAREQAEKLVREIALMTDREREAIAARLPTVINPDGHALSERNTILLHKQSGRSDLTVVAGYRQWMQNGRIVKQGEKAVGLIAVPLKSKRRDDSGEPIVDPETGDAKQNLKFRYTPVFDISQTGEFKILSVECIGVETIEPKLGGDA